MKETTNGSLIHRIAESNDLPGRNRESDGLSIEEFRRLQQERNNRENQIPPKMLHKRTPMPIPEKIERTPKQAKPQRRFEHEGLEQVHHSLFCDNTVLKRENGQLRERQSWLEHRVQILEVTVARLKEVNAELQEEACHDS